MKIMLSFLILVILSSFVCGQEPPDVDTATFQNIHTQHELTRKFFSEELTRKETQFFNNFEQRAKNYEGRVENMISTAVWKLSLLWGGIVFVIFGLSNFLGRKLEKRKWRKMMDSAKEEIMTDIKKEKAQMEQTLKEKESALSKRVINLKKEEQDFDKTKSSVIKQTEALKKAEPKLKNMYAKMKEQERQMQEIMNKVEI